MADDGMIEMPLGNTGLTLWISGGGKGDLTFGTRESRKPLPDKGRTKEEQQMIDDARKRLHDNDWKTIFEGAAGLTFKW